MAVNSTSFVHGKSTVQNCLKFILSNRRCVLLLGAWWIHVEHAKQTERMNLTIKNHGIWKINKVNTPILNWPSLTMLFFFFRSEDSTWTWQSIPRDLQQNTRRSSGGCRLCLKTLTWAAVWVVVHPPSDLNSYLCKRSICQEWDSNPRLQE